MVHAYRTGAAIGRSKRPPGWVVGVFVLFVAGLLFVAGWIGDALAFSTSLKYHTENQGKREVLSFFLPPGVDPPRLELMDLQMLRVTVHGILALPSYVLDPERSRWISNFKVDGIPGGALGIHIFIGLKEPNLSFRDSLGDTDPITGTPYRLEIDQLPPPVVDDRTTLLEGRALAGRDGTLVLISRIGRGPVETAVELAARTVRVVWPNASLASSWRPVKPEGLLARLLAYDFAKEHVEMEMELHVDVVDVDFHQDDDAGLFIIELTSKSNIGRRDNARDILKARKEATASGVTLPLNRLDPIFDPRHGVSMTLQGETVDETFYMRGARASSRDHKFALARAYLDTLLRLFPETPNRQLIETYRWDLASNMDWKPGWLLSELNALLAKYPNMLQYPHYRLEQLRLLNRATRYGEAAAIMWDPNLPKDRADVWLERGHTAMGLAHSGIEPKKHWRGAVQHLREALDMAKHKGDVSAEANFLLVRMAHEQGQNGDKSAVQLLEELSDEQVSRIASHPEWLMFVGDLYYENGLYPEAFKRYSQFMFNYPGMEDIYPWALVRAAESSRQMGRRRDAARLFETLQKRYPDSNGAAWGRVFELRMDRSKDVAVKLKRLDDVIASLAVPDVLSAALKNKAELQGEAHLYREALRTLNNLLSLSSRERIVNDAKKMKRDYLVSGMRYALSEDRPEYAIMLAEMHGDDWRDDPDFIPARLSLSEALLRLGMWDEALKWLDKLSAPPAPSLGRLARAFAAGQWPEVAASAALRVPFSGIGRADTSAASPDALPTALAAMEESVPRVEDGLSRAGTSPVSALQTVEAVRGAEEPSRGGPVHDVSVAEARVRLAQAIRLLDQRVWDGILNLLEQLPSRLLNEEGRAMRLLLMAKAEAGRTRYPQAVGYMETLFSTQAVGDGIDFYWYATLLQQWKGDDKAFPVYEQASTEASDKEVQALARVRMGDIRQRQGAFADAVENYRQAASLMPTSPWAKVASENASQLELAMEVTQ